MSRRVKRVVVRKVWTRITTGLRHITFNFSSCWLVIYPGLVPGSIHTHFPFLALDGYIGTDKGLVQTSAKYAVCFLFIPLW